MCGEGNTPLSKQGQVELCHTSVGGVMAASNDGPPGVDHQRVAVGTALGMVGTNLGVTH